MRFSTLVSSALLVGFAAAAPTVQSSSSGSGCNSGNCGSNQGSNYGGSNQPSMMSEKPMSTMMSEKPMSTMMSEKAMSTMMSEKAMSTKVMMSSKAMMTEAPSSTQKAAATSAAPPMPSYGSGSWGGSGYNDCVQKCIASYGAPPATWTPSATQGSMNDGAYHGSKGTGATHTVIVAPTQGVLRYVPFAVNASVGDTIQFVWNAKNHTVTKSSALEICNKTSSQPFSSGEHDAPFTFTQVVNDTNPTFFYCGTPGHCQKGMFGVINPPSNFMGPSSVGQTMSTVISNSSDMAAMMAYTNSLTGSNDKAASWGQNIDLASLPSWSHSLVMENVMYTRSFLGANPEVLKADGSIDMSGNTPMMIPTDMASVNAMVSNAAASPSSSANSASATSAAPSASAKPKGNGAASTAASTALLGVAAIAAAVLAL